MSKVLGLHLSDTEFTQWTAWAEREGLTLTKWVRRLVVDHVAYTKPLTKESTTNPKPVA